MCLENTKVKMFDYKIYEENLKSEILGRSFKFLNKTQSTNDEAKKYSAASHGHTILTYNQIKGRGRRNNKWFSTPNKSLTFTIMLEKMKISNQNILSLLTSVVIVNTIKKKLKVNCKIKWPNDIILNNKKIGGILIESNANFQIIGIGLNVNQAKDDFNREISKIGSSLYYETKTKINLEKLLAQIISEFEIVIKEKKKNILKQWLDNCDHIHHKVKFSTNNEIITGIFEGINQEGEAIININGKISTFSSGIVNT